MQQWAEMCKNFITISIDLILVSVLLTLNKSSLLLYY